MAQRIEKKEEFILKRKQFEAKKQAGELIAGATYHITDDPTVKDLIDGVQISKKAEIAEKDSLNNIIIDTYRRKDDSYSAKETQDKLDEKVTKFDGSEETGVLRQTVYGQELGEEKNIPFSNNAQEFTLAQYSEKGKLIVSNPENDLEATNKKYVDDLILSESNTRSETDKNLQQNIETVDNKLNKDILKSYEIVHDTNSVHLNNTFINLNTGVESTNTKDINLVNDNTAGLMSTSDYKSLRELQSRVGNLEGKTTRLLYTEKTNPTAEDIQSFINSFTNEHLESDYKEPYEGLTIVIDETFHIWRYYENDNIGWRDDGVDSVHQFTNTTKGIIQGSTEDGKIYAETDGTGSVNGWDDLKTSVNTNKTNIETNTKDIEALDKQVSTNKDNIKDLQDNKVDIIQGNGLYEQKTDGTRVLRSIGQNTPTANNVVTWTSNKTIKSEGPIANDDVSTKLYVDTGLLNKSTIRDSSNNIKSEVIINNTPTEGQVPLYDSNKNIKTSTPVADDDAVNKAYMDQHSGKIDTISVNGTNQTIDSNKNIDITIPVVDAKFKDTSIIQNKEIILPNDLVQDSNYIHTDNNFTTAEKTTLSELKTLKDTNQFTKVDDVKVNNTSVVESKIANINIGHLTFSETSQIASATDFTKDITLHKVAASGKYADILEKPEIIDNLNSESSTNVLSARQGFELKKMIQGVNKAASYDSLEALIESLNNATSADFNIGQNLYLQSTDIPDFWIYSIEDSKVTYSYTNQETFLNDIKTNNTLQIGYYNISIREADKIDLTDYATINWTTEEINKVDNKLTTHTNETSVKLSTIEQNVTNLINNKLDNTFNGAGIYGDPDDIDTVAFDVVSTIDELPENSKNTEVFDSSTYHGQNDGIRIQSKAAWTPDLPITYDEFIEQNESFGTNFIVQHNGIRSYINNQGRGKGYKSEISNDIDRGFQVNSAIQTSDELNITKQRSISLNKDGLILSSLDWDYSSDRYKIKGSTIQIPENGVFSVVHYNGQHEDVLEDIYPATSSIALGDTFTYNGEEVATQKYVDEKGGKIDTISVNGEQQTITGKNVDITIPTDYIKPTDYATQSKAGIVTGTATYGVTFNSAGGIMGMEKTKDQYDSATDGMFISKGTLENVKEYLTKDSLTNSTINWSDDDKAKTKALLGINTDISSASSEAISSSNSYTDDKIAAFKEELYGENSTETLDTIKEIADAIEENKDILNTLNSAIGNKVDNYKQGYNVINYSLGNTDAITIDTTLNYLSDQGYIDTINDKAGMSDGIILQSKIQGNDDIPIVLPSTEFIKNGADLNFINNFGTNFILNMEGINSNTVSGEGNESNFRINKDGLNYLHLAKDDRNGINLSQIETNYESLYLTNSELQESGAMFVSSIGLSQAGNSMMHGCQTAEGSLKMMYADLTFDGFAITKLSDNDSKTMLYTGDFLVVNGDIVATESMLNNLISSNNANTTEINNKTITTKVITPNNLDYSVKKALSDSKTTWSDTDKDNVKSLLNISSDIDTAKTNAETNSKNYTDSQVESVQTQLDSFSENVLEFSQDVYTNFATKQYVDSKGGKIDSISVNGTTQTIDSDKNVDITVPELYNSTGQSVKGTLTQKAITDTLNSYVPIKNTDNEFILSEYESIWTTQTPGHLLGLASTFTEEDGTLLRTMNILTENYLFSICSNSDSEDSYGTYALQAISPGTIQFMLHDGSSDYAKSILFDSSGITFDDKKVLLEGDINETEAGTYLTKAGNYLHVDKTTLFNDISKETATAITTAKNEIKNELLGEGAHEDLNTISELSSALQNNKDIITTLNNAISNKASKDQIHDGVLTIQKTGVNLGSFTANQSTNTTINIPEGVLVLKHGDYSDSYYYDTKYTEEADLRNWVTYNYPYITEYYEGLTIAYKVPGPPGNTSTKISINNLGYAYVVTANLKQISKDIKPGTFLILTYCTNQTIYNVSQPCWVMSNYIPEEYVTETDINNKLTNMMTTNSAQTISGSKSFTTHQYFKGGVASSSTSNTSQIVMTKSDGTQQWALTSNDNTFIVNPNTTTTTGQLVCNLGNMIYMAGADLGRSASKWKDLYLSGGIYNNSGNKLTLPSSAGTLALTSQIPTDYAPSVHTHTKSEITDFGSYLPTSGGTLTGNVVVKKGSNWSQFQAYSASNYYRAFESNDDRARIDVRDTTNTTDRRYIDIYSGSAKTDNDESVQIVRNSATDGTTSTYVATQNWVTNKATALKATTANTVDVTDTTPSSATMYYPLYTTGRTTGQTVRANQHLYYYDAGSWASLNLGAAGSKGILTIHTGASSDNYVDISPNTLTANRTLTIPDKSGTIATTSDIPTGAAASKGVVTTIDTSANLPTSNAVKTFVEGKGYLTASSLSSNLTNYVTINTSQTISGAKTFSGIVIVPDVTII